MLCSFCHKDLLFETTCIVCDKKACRDCRGKTMSSMCKGWKCKICLSPKTLVFEQTKACNSGCVFCGGSGLDWQSSRDGFMCSACNGSGSEHIPPTAVH